MESYRSPRYLTQKVDQEECPEPCRDQQKLWLQRDHTVLGCLAGHGVDTRRSPPLDFVEDRLPLCGSGYASQNTACYPEGELALRARHYAYVWIVVVWFVDASYVVWFVDVWFADAWFAVASVAWSDEHFVKAFFLEVLFYLMGALRNGRTS
jgi:hypothetical protein